MMTDETPTEASEAYEAVVNGSGYRRQWWLIVALVGVSVTMVVILGVSQLSDVFSRTDVNTETAGDACVRDNQFRREVNRQAEAFVHHNDATLDWAIVVRRILDRSTARGEDAFRATNTLVREYRMVRDEYFTLPLLDCSDPDRGRVSPSRPVAP